MHYKLLLTIVWLFKVFVWFWNSFHILQLLSPFPKLYYTFKLIISIKSYQTKTVSMSMGFVNEKCRLLRHSYGGSNFGACLFEYLNFTAFLLFCFKVDVALYTVIGIVHLHLSAISMFSSHISFRRHSVGLK